MGPPNSSVTSARANQEICLEPASAEQRKKSSGEVSPLTRNKMKKYWEVYSPSIESMMLSHDAPKLSVEEQKEVMSYLTQEAYVGKNVLELGAGIGRYTLLLSNGGVAQITAVDFMDSYVKENRRINGHKDNVTLLCADVTKLNFKEQSFDLVFSNWLLMYLTDAEVKSLLQRALSWLKPGGYLFIRESCYHPSGNVKREENPTLYRTPLDYCEVFSRISEDGACYRLVKAKNLLTYVKHYHNPNQLCFLVRREDLPSGAVVGASSATPDTIMFMEALNDKGWLNSGGSELARDLLARLGSLSDQSVLDASCGSGGLVFLLAEQGAASVLGVASSPSALHFALRHQEAQDKDILSKTSFELCATLDDSERYDVVCATDLTFSADTLAILTGKLTEGGRLLVGVYTTTGPATDGGLPTVPELEAAAGRVGLRYVSVSSCPAVLSSLMRQQDALKIESLAEDHSTVMLTSYAGELAAMITKLQSGEVEYSILQGSL